ncbi:MAG: hypothetical protein KBT13_09020 [Bacteroidales bacterium]|nr:hypothetical protein [Candidatus Sodaliphilus limicaballi]
MNRFHSTLAALCLAVATLICCTSATPVKGKHHKKTNKTMTASKSKATSETIKSFRYELYKDGVSEVYFFSYDSQYSHGSFYTRDMGSSTGWNYTVDSAPVAPLSELAAELNVNDYPDGDLDKEDTSRDRWIIQVEYASGKEKTIMTYTDDRTASNDKVVRDKAEAVFKAIKYQDKNGKMMGEYSKLTYSGGKLVKEINYTEDGIVHGGRDYSRPEPNDLEYALPPKTY